MARVLNPCRLLLPFAMVVPFASCCSSGRRQRAHAHDVAAALEYVARRNVAPRAIMGVERLGHDEDADAPRAYADLAALYRHVAALGEEEGRRLRVGRDAQRAENRAVREGRGHAERLGRALGIHHAAHLRDATRQRRGRDLEQSVADREQEEGLGIRGTMSVAVDVTQDEVSFLRLIRS